MEKKQLAKLGVSLGLVAALGAGATLAYLSDNAGPLTNTFVFTEKGIELTLDEAKYGSTNGERTDIGNNYTELVANQLLEKDPTVTVKANSLNSNVFVSVTNANAEDILRITDLNSESWTEINPSDYGMKAVDNTTYYVYDGIKGTGVVETDDAFKVVPNANTNTVLEDVFEHVQVGNVEGSTTFTDIVIKAAAVQADSATDADAATTALGLLGATK